MLAHNVSLRPNAKLLGEAGDPALRIEARDLFDVVATVEGYETLVRDDQAREDV